MKLQHLFNTLSASMVGRDGEIRALLRALIAQEHALLLGPPGTGKSYITAQIAKAIGVVDDEYFRVLLTRFSTPEEIFGPNRLTMLKQDEYVRNTDRRLPVAKIGLVDEIFKASSAIINSLLTIMQERVFDNGGTTIQCPLRTLIGASNEFPEPGELDAIYDRFLVRRWVEYVPKHLRQKLLFAPMIPATQAVTLDELDLANAESAILQFTPEAQEVFLKITETLESECAIVVGDRRMGKAIKIAQAEAWMDESDCVKPYHLECLTDVYWSTLDNRRKVEETVRRLSNPDELVLVEWIEYLDTLRGKRLGAGDQAEAGSAVAKLVGMLGKMDDMQQTDRIGKIRTEVADLMINMNAILTNQSVDAHQKLRQRLAANRLAKA